MPHIVFTVEEIAAHLIEEMRATSAEILALADLKTKPLDPGESPDARYHKIAKLGKRLAASFVQFDDVVKRATGILSDENPTPAVPVDTSQAN